MRSCFIASPVAHGLLGPAVAVAALVLAVFLRAAVSSAAEEAAAQAGEGAEEFRDERTFTLRPIGEVKKSDGRTTIAIEKRHEKGLLGLDGFSHAYVIWWFDRNDRPAKRSVLQVHPMGNPRNPLTGVFATRSPVRPNLIALSLCKVVSVKGCEIEVETIDAFDRTPVLDVKPFIPGYDSVADAEIPGWLRLR